jgi:hypothetical protein
MLYFLSLLLQRLPLTLGFIGSMAATIYVSMVLHSYILSVLFSVIQVSTFMLPFFFFFMVLFFLLGLWTLDCCSFCYPVIVGYLFTIALLKQMCKCSGCS